MIRFAHDFTREEIDALLLEMPFLKAAQLQYALFRYLADKEERLEAALSSEGLAINPALREIFTQANATPEMLEQARTVHLITKEETESSLAANPPTPQPAGRLLIVRLLGKQGAMQGELTVRWKAAPTAASRKP